MRFAAVLLVTAASASKTSVTELQARVKEVGKVVTSDMRGLFANQLELDNLNTQSVKLLTAAKQYSKVASKLNQVAEPERVEVFPVPPKPDECRACMINMPVLARVKAMLSNEPVALCECLQFDRVRNHSKLDTSLILGKVEMQDPVVTPLGKTGMKIKCSAEFTYPGTNEGITGTVAEYAVPDGENMNPLNYEPGGFHFLEKIGFSPKVNLVNSDGINSELRKRTLEKYRNALADYKIVMLRLLHERFFSRSESIGKKEFITLNLVVPT